MRRQTLIALGAALIFGLLAVFLANTYLSATKARNDAQGTSKIAVATVPLSFGVDITPDKVRYVDFPNSSIPPGAFQNTAELLPRGTKRIALMPIAINEPILASKISGAGKGASIASLLPAGMRAAAVRINDVSGVAGFVQPNDSVDVLITRTVSTADRSVQATDILLQNVRVIAIDQQSRNADGTPKVAKTVTLEVTPLDAQKLALAQEVGSLSLVLRKPGEINNPVVETVSMADLRYNMYGGARYPSPAVVGGYGSAAGGPVDGSATRITVAPKPRRSAPAKPPAPTVQIYRGVQGNTYVVGNNGH